MNTRKLTPYLFLIPALLFGVAAAASEFPIDGGGIPPRNETATGNLPSDADCPPSRSASPGPSAKYVSDLSANSAPDETAATRVADESGGVPKESATRTGGSSATQIAPKIRTNRWQSLVPGAIK